MRRYFLTLCFDGSAYCGWQSQPNGTSVQTVVEQALTTLLRSPIALTGAGRTDAGVHAAQMVAHLDAELSNETTDSLLNRLNRLLPPDIAATRLCEVCADAHARFSATSRTYKYYVTTRKSPFTRRYAMRLYHMPDTEQMNRAARLLIGTHDFSSFCKVHTDVKTHDCRVTRTDWTFVNTAVSDRPGNTQELNMTDIVFTITADRFLRNMVRAVVGTLLDVGRGRLSVADFADIIARRDRCAAGTSVPAHALFLTDITYPENIFIANSE